MLHAIFVLSFLYILVPRICILKSCRSSESKHDTLFSFPTNPSRLQQWIELLRPELPPGLNLSDYKSHRICHLHFPSHSIYSVGASRKRLLQTALPLLITSSAESSNHKGVQVDSHHHQRKHLESKVRQLRNKIAQLKSDPPVSLIKKNIHKLRHCMSSEAFTFLESSVNNHTKHPNGRRHTLSSKQLTNSIYMKSSKAYRIIKPIFDLPSIRTLDRHNQNIFTSTGITKETKSDLKNHASSMDFNDRFCILSFDETEISPEFRYLAKRDIVDGFVDMGNHGRTDKIAKSGLVFGLRGISSRWKMFLSYYFTSKESFNANVLKKIVEENLIAVMEAGLRVVATVCDGAAINRSLFNHFNVDSTSSKYTFNNQQLYFLHDVPHIIKLIRNNLVTHGFYIKFDEESHGIIRWHDITTHLKPMVTNPQILSECPKLRIDHLSFNTHKKMKVSLATQLFSHSVASSFKYAVEQERLPRDPYLLIANTFKFIDKLFDVLNSSSISLQNGKPWKTSLRKDDENIKFLEQAAKMLEDNNWYFIDSSKRQPSSSILTPALPPKNNKVKCLEMLRQTIRGILSLCDHLFNQHNFNHIPTRRFNQDILENFFAQLRFSSTNLSTLHFRLKFRASRILFRDSLVNVSSNCEPDEDLDLHDFEESSDATTSSFEEEIAETFQSFASSSDPSHRNRLSEFFATFSADDVDEDYGCIVSPRQANLSHQGLIAYIAGYIFKRIKDSKLHCDICFSVLGSSTILEEHLFIICKNYFPDMEVQNHLHLPSAQLTSATSEFVKSLQDHVPSLIHVIGVKYHISKLFENKNHLFSFIPSCHQQIIKREIIRRLTNMFIGKHLKDLKEHHKSKSSIKAIQRASRPSSL